MAETSEVAAPEQQSQTAQEAPAQAQTVELSEATDTAAGGRQRSIDVLLDMTVPVTVVIGSTEIPVQRLLQLGPGSVVKLDKPIEAPVDLYLKDVKFATATVVVVEDRFAVRVKEVLGTDQAGSQQ